MLFRTGQQQVALVSSGLHPACSAERELMKRSRSPPSPSSTPLKTSTTQNAMACPHLTAAFSALTPPRPSQQVHKEECTLCFDDYDGPDGIDVCMLCFNGGCTGNGDREHSRLHHEKTQHSLVVNIKRTPKPVAPNATASPSAPKKLAISAETDADKYDYMTTPRCLACDPSGPGQDLPNTDKVVEVVSGIMNAMSSAQQNEVKAWEEEIVACQHTNDLVQPGSPIKLEPSGLASCGLCDLTSNLWLCLTCGHLGCGRAQFGGVGGNGHGLTHFEQSGHPVSVKQGTITAEGNADIYCYACNDARLDPKLAHHLNHFGISVLDLSKTEKSMTELQIEQNLRFDFNMTGDDGKQLEPLFGPGLTGMRNLGNSCYLASVLQSVFALPAFQTRYSDAYRPHTLMCANKPSECFECQMTKMADGLRSGRYSTPRKPEPMHKDNADWQASGDHQHQPLFQQGIKPSMLKALVGKGHEEFSTMRQQDADEFFKYLVGLIQKENKKVAASAHQGVPTDDPTSIFGFGLQQRLQCMQCRKVRYSVERQDAGLSLPVPIRPKPAAASADEAGKAPVEGRNAVAPAAHDAGRIEYEPVSLIECLDLFTNPEELEYNCPSCATKVVATKQMSFTSFPQVLAIQVRRFQLLNWVPQKVAVPILVPLEPFALDKYLGSGIQADEEELPHEEAAPAGGVGEPVFDAAAMSQLASMGFPEIRCKKALLATGNSDAEAAMNWLFAHMEDADIDEPIDFSVGHGGGGSGGNAGPIAGPDTSMLEDMGFTKSQARKALRVTSNNAEAAVGWLFENPDDVGEDEVPSTDETALPSSTSSGPDTIPGSTDLPARYTLKSFISHKGPSVHSGHYVAHVHYTASQQDEWVFFNDEKVVKAPISSTVPSTSDRVQDGPAASTLDDVGVKGISQQAYEYFFELTN